MRIRIYNTDKWGEGERVFCFLFIKRNNLYTNMNIAEREVYSQIHTELWIGSNKEYDILPYLTYTYDCIIKFSLI